MQHPNTTTQRHRPPQASAPMATIAFARLSRALTPAIFLRRSRHESPNPRLRPVQVRQACPHGVELQLARLAGAGVRMPCPPPGRRRRRVLLGGDGRPLQGRVDLDHLCLQLAPVRRRAAPMSESRTASPRYVPPFPFACDDCASPLSLTVSGPFLARKPDDLLTQLRFFSKKPVALVRRFDGKTGHRAALRGSPRRQLGTSE